MRVITSYSIHYTKLYESAVAESVENDPTYREIIESSRSVHRQTVADGIVAAAREIAESTDISAICCYTQSGKTVALIGRERPRVPIIALSPVTATLRIV